MALPTPNYPGSAWDGNEQSTANDTAADNTVANGADHNEAAAEVKAIGDDLRLAMTAAGTAQADGIEGVVEALRPSYGQLVVVSGTQSVGTGWGAVSGSIDGNSKGGTYVAHGSDTLTIGADGAGLYRVTISVRATAPAAAWQLDFGVDKNGSGSPLSESITAQELTVSGKEYQITHSVIMLSSLADTDTLELLHRGSSAQTLTMSGGFSVERIA